MFTNVENSTNTIYNLRRMEMFIYCKKPIQTQNTF